MADLWFVKTVATPGPEDNLLENSKTFTCSESIAMGKGLFFYHELAQRCCSGAS
jgi:hypothetical protein